MPLVDTWVWVEYFQGSTAGRRVRPVVEGPEVFTSIITFAELSDLYGREGLPGLDERLMFIRSRGPVLATSQGAARAAGATKWAQRKKGHPLGLADALIYETARERGLDVVTGDPGFQGLPGVTMVGARST